MRRVFILTTMSAFYASPAAAQSLSGIVRSLSVQVPEPGMLLLFGMGSALLGLRMGRKK